VSISLYEPIALNVKHNLKPKPELFNDVNGPSKTNETIKKRMYFQMFPYCVYTSIGIAIIQ